LTLYSLLAILSAVVNYQEVSLTKLVLCSTLRTCCSCGFPTERRHDTIENPYYQAARFENKAKAGAVYTPLQEQIFEEQEHCDLSVYRIRITKGCHVVVVGERPPESLHLRIEAVLTHGTLVTLRPDVLGYLQARRTQATQIASWVEGHYDYLGEES
jgi:hypothetical protein